MQWRGVGLGEIDAAVHRAAVKDAMRQAEGMADFVADEHQPIAVLGGFIDQSFCTVETHSVELSTGDLGQIAISGAGRAFIAIIFVSDSST